MTENPGRMIDARLGLLRQLLIGNVADKHLAVLHEKQIDLDGIVEHGKASRMQWI
jgi:hypothetical protein